MSQDNEPFPSRAVPGPDEYVTVQRARVRAVMDVLSLAAVGAFDHQGAFINIEQQDEFALLEQTLNIFTHELSEARRENERHVQRLLASQRELEEKLATIEAQQQAIARLAAPVVEIWTGVLALPVIGLVDERRAADMTEVVLQRVVASGASSLVVDVTGAATFDASTAEYLVRLLRSVRLLGCHCVLTGISPENARTLAALDVDFEDIRTYGSLKQGLEACIRHVSAGAPPPNGSSQAGRAGSARSSSSP